MIVCEVGLNHLGRESYSRQYIHRLIDSKCDAITYQIREAKFYEKHYCGYDLSFDHYTKMRIMAKHNHTKFGFALANHDLLEECQRLGVDCYKVVSWD